MAGLQHDVVTPDQVALGLVEAILEQATFSPEAWGSIYALRYRLGVILDNATRLKVLLEKGNEATALRELLSGQAVDIAERETAVRELRAEKAALLAALKKVDAIFAPNEVALKLKPSVLTKATGERAIPYPLMIEVRAAIEAAS
jgi:hypothetical protein